MRMCERSAAGLDVEAVQDAADLPRQSRGAAKGATKAAARPPRGAAKGATKEVARQPQRPATTARLSHACGECRTRVR